MAKTNLSLKDLVQSQLKNAAWLGDLSQHLNEYEKRLKSVVKDLDLKSRDARDKSRKQLDTFTKQLKKTRTDLEKRVKSLVNQEAKRLNEGFNELVTYLKSLSVNEQQAAAAAASGKATTKASVKTSVGAKRKATVSTAAPRSKKNGNGPVKTTAKKKSTSKSGKDSIGMGSPDLTSSLPV
jgi:methyl-accepting chemotaxis protein